MSRTISGTAGTLVTLSAVGDNPATVAYNAVLQAGLYGEGTTAWTVTNFGTIRNSGILFAVTLNDGGTLSNAAAGVISASSGVEILGAAGTVTNAGSILGGPGVGVSLADGGFVTNASGARISAAQRGVVITGAAGTVINSGVLLTSATGAKGVYLYEGGQVTNQAGATISAYAAVKFANTDAGTVTNAGSIYGINNGVYLLDGGMVANLSGATITSGGRAVNVIGSAAATVTNAGVISGTVAAVRFTAGYADRLIVDPGASFNGSVYGGNSIGGTAVSTLELASGSSAGTLSSLGSQVTLFGNVSIDSGAIWTLTADTIGSGYTITDSGTLTNTGTLGSTVTLGSNAVLTNAAGARVSAASAVGAVYLKGTAGTLLNSGTITATGTYGAVMGAAAGAYVSNASGGTITGFKGVSLSSGTVVNTGVIKSSGSTGSSAGVIVVSGTISNAAGGTISGGRGAVYLGNSLGGSGTLINSGLVSGISYGVSNRRQTEWVTNLSGGTITGSTGVYDQGTVSNAGLIIGTSNIGVNLRPGLLTNLATGTIMSQGGRGVFANNVATIINAGLISATKASGIGVLLQEGGLVTNQSGGTIAGGLYGVKVYNTAATVTNAGSISGGTDAVLFVAGIAGRLIVDPGAAFTGTVNGGNTIGSTAVSTLELASGASVGTLSGLGSKYINFARTTVDAGATWSLTGGSFGAGYSLSNFGTLNQAVTLGTGAVLSNASSGLITASAASAVYASTNATVFNAGRISDGAAKAVYLLGGGFVSNASGGTLTGSVGVKFGVGGGGTIVNAGSIYGSNDGIYLRDGGTVTNLASGTIVSANHGIYVNGAGAATVVNAGSIGGTIAAVKFTAGFADRLIVDPGASFGGSVDGGNSIGSTIVSTLELASGSSAGTLSGLGAQVTRFGTITIDSGARWLLSSDTIGSGYAIADAGTLTNAGSLGSAVTLGIAAALTNAATGVITSGGTAAIYLTDNDTLLNAGVVSATGTTGRGVFASSVAVVVSNASTGTITGTANGVYLNNANTLINAGLIAATGTGSQGVHTDSAADFVSNAATGTITAATGVYLASDATLVNRGVISGTTTGIYASDAVTVTNAGSISGGTYAVRFQTGSSGNLLVIDPGASFSGAVNGGNSIGSTIVTALELASGSSAGTLTGLGTEYTDFATIAIDSGATWTLTADTIGSGYTITDSGTLTNTGTLGSTVTLGASAVLTNAAGARISAASAVGSVYLKGTAGTLLNSGVITATGTYGAVMGAAAGAYVSNSSGGTITGFKAVSLSSGTVVNTGVIKSSVTTGGSAGVVVVSGTISNAAGGTISGGRAAVYLGNSIGGSGTLINSGLVSGISYGVSNKRESERVTNLSGGTITGATGVYVQGTVSNAGLIIGTSGSGVNLRPGALTNLATGTIMSQGAAGRGVFANNVATIINAGLISDTKTSGIGILLQEGGLITNQSGGTIAGGLYGVKVYNIAATVTNAGSISGGTDAVVFLPGIAGRLIVDPGAAFTATVNGGNTIGSATVSTLELASGSSAGTLNSLGSQVTLFDNVSIDSGATWTLTADTIGSGYTITDSGTLTNTGTLGSTVTLGASAVLTNAAGARVSAASSVGSVYLKGTAGTLLNSGIITATGTYGAVMGAAAGVYVSNASGGTITGFKAVSLSSGTVVNTGVIKSSVTTGGSAGVVVVSGTISNAAGGTISGGRAAVYLGNSLGGSGTLINSGLVSGISYGVTNKRESERVTNLSGGTITGATGVYVQGTVSNAGLIIGTGGSGVNLRPGALTNLATGTIMSQGAAGRGVFANNVATIINAGLISATKASGIGILLQEGGLITNQSGGTIAGGLYGVKVYNIAATVTNAGSISGGTDAVVFLPGIAGRLIVDPGAAFTGTVNGGNTIGSTTVSTLELASGASVGTLTGLGSKYINFARTTIDAGATWTLTGGNSLASGISLTNAGTLALSGATLTDAGTLTNNGVILIDPSTLIAGGLVGSGSVTIEAASTVVVSGTVAAGETIDFSARSGAFYVTPGGGNFAGVIDGFRTGDTIGLTGISDASSATIVSGNTLAVTTGSEGIIDLRMDPLQSFAGATFNVVESGGNALITANNLPCFVAGTLLDTPQGPMEVETLRTGDPVATASGAVRPVRWIGRRRLDPSRHPSPARAQPIRIAAGAIAPGLPRRDLLVSPDHALLLDGMLIIARLLLNGASIRQEAWRSVTYVHVELDAHDILLAEGLPAESYLDTGNRGMFENAGRPLVLHPAFETNDQARRVAGSCAPLLNEPTVVEPIWRRLAARAETLGWALPDPPPVTDDPALCVVQNGRRIGPAVVQDGRYMFILPAGGAARLVSRHAVPGLLRPWIEDNRRLGVMVRRLTLRRSAEVIPLPLDHPALDDGWWAVEHHGRTMSRWTDGDGALPLPDHEGTAILEVELAGTVAYPASANARRPVAAAVTDAAPRT